ncbi:YscO family type III secretion system apparatus protein [Telmatospirillum sp. J64-1]|uniref:type III secretion system stalk subunit SctO n=1 Tax=Telmatospirillum sp. J64-1 TaxID=2502183 RepID=UPI00115E9000|nr:YscO family type III secretion system apparatus protein [Telmatospirillum sp. J64-1]
MSVFTELLRIKEFRETQAETEVQRRRVLLAEAAEAVETLNRKLEEYRIWSLEHERGLYADLCTRLVKLREIEELQHRVADLRNQERNLEQGILDAEKQRHQATSALDTAVERLRDAERQKGKFTELARIYSEEARLELERMEELEMEEFQTPDRDDEWQGGEEDESDSAFH